MSNSIITAQVKSSSIESATYRPKNETMVVKFMNGDSYRYSSVPNRVFVNFYMSESKGKYLNTKIKNKYPTKKVSSAQPNIIKVIVPTAQPATNDVATQTTNNTI